MKNKKIILIVLCICILIFLIPNILYIKHFYSNELSNNPEVWGQYGDYLGGSLNPILTIINIGVLLYLTYTVSRSDDKRIINQFKFDAYKDLKDKLKPFKEDYDTVNLLMKEYEKTKIDLTNFQQFSVFLYENNELKNKLLVLIEEIELSCRVLKESGDIHSLKAADKFSHMPNILSGENDFNNKSQTIENMKLELLSIMQNQIINKN